MGSALCAVEVDSLEMTFLCTQMYKNCSKVYTQVFFTSVPVLNQAIFESICTLESPGRSSSWKTTPASPSFAGGVGPHPAVPRP